MIEREVKSSSVIYRCTDCNIELAEHTYVDEVIIYTSCNHYKWFDVSSECFYYMLPGCGRSVINWLKKNYIVKLEAPGTVYLLLPRQS